MAYFQPKRLPLDGPAPNLGPGQSRPKPSESTRLFRLRVEWSDRRAMLITIPAPTKAKAMLYCRNRWPDCSVEAER